MTTTKATRRYPTFKGSIYSGTRNGVWLASVRSAELAQTAQVGDVDVLRVACPGLIGSYQEVTVTRVAAGRFTVTTTERITP